MTYVLLAVLVGLAVAFLKVWRANRSLIATNAKLIATNESLIATNVRLIAINHKLLHPGLHR
jgi:hypothetical protein